jgi:ribA/ribD-fused uncharacterized protein
MTIIDRFTKETGYDFLSNFYPSTVRFEGALYPTLEHAYQAAKTTDHKIREIIRKANGPNEAKKLGQGVINRDDWFDIRLNVMRKLIKEKFSNPFLTHRLLATGDSQLVLVNKWNDKFWGVCRGEGENWLGKILMEVRDDLKQEAVQDF